MSTGSLREDGGGVLRGRGHRMAWVYLSRSLVVSTVPSPPQWRLLSHEETRLLVPLSPSTTSRDPHRNGVLTLSFPVSGGVEDLVAVGRWGVVLLFTPRPRGPRVGSPFPEVDRVSRREGRWEDWGRPPRLGEGRWRSDRGGYMCPCVYVGVSVYVCVCVYVWVSDTPFSPESVEFTVSLPSFTSIRRSRGVWKWKFRLIFPYFRYSVISSNFPWKVEVSSEKVILLHR